MSCVMSWVMCAWLVFIIIIHPPLHCVVLFLLSASFFLFS